MKLTTDKYGRVWLVNYRTYTLLNINHTGVIPKQNNLETTKQ
jgi:hypothetical protein